jgi:hypothetical protein
MMQQQQSQRAEFPNENILVDAISSPSEEEVSLSQINIENIGVESNDLNLTPRQEVPNSSEIAEDD